MLYNTGEPPKAIFDRYAKEGEVLVGVDTDRLERVHYLPVGRDLIAHEAVEKKQGDKLAAHRSFIRHDAEALNAAIRELL